MHAFVTGATGLLGHNLVRHLVAQGHRVTALVRSEEKARRLLAGLPVSVVRGDVLEVRSVAPHLGGCDVLFHTAAYFRECLRPGAHAEALERVNVEAPLTLFRAARVKGVQRIVHVSAAGVVGRKPDGSPGDEDSVPEADGATATPLQRAVASKLRAEQRVHEATLDEGLPVVRVLPGWMFGPYDAAPTHAGQLVLDFLARRLPGLPGGEGGSILVDARDVAAGMLAAAERGRVGGRYILGGHFTPHRELFRLLERVSGVPAPRRVVPLPVLLGLARMADTVGRLTGWRSPLPAEGVRTLGCRLEASSARAKAELGATFRPVEETLADTVAWLRTHRGLPAGDGSRRAA